MQRIARNLSLFLASVLIAAVFHRCLASKGSLFWLSMASAYGSLVMLALSLMIGPWNRLRGRPNPVSGYLRRDVGIWAGVLGSVHVIAGLQVHQAGKFWLYFLPPADASQSFPMRIDPFGLTNYAGLGAALILLLLLSLSNNACLRSLGTRRWKSLQRWSYAAALLVAVHGAVYQILEKRTAGFVAAFAGIALLALAMQLAGFRETKRREHREAGRCASHGSDSRG